MLATLLSCGSRKLEYWSVNVANCRCALLHASLREVIILLVQAVVLQVSRGGSRGQSIGIKPPLTKGGTDEGKDLYFGSTNMNNSTVVEEVAKEGGDGMAATLFVKDGDRFTRVATTVPKALGTALTGPVLESIKVGKPYYGEADVLGTPYISDYEPIEDASGAIIGIYFVGHKKT